MTKRLKKILFCSVCLVSSMAQALTLNATLTGKELVWQNGMMYNSDITTTNWLILGDLAPTTIWSPGTFIHQPPGTINLSDGVSSVSIPLNVRGMQYGLGTAANHFNAQGDTNPNGGSCTGNLGPVISSVYGPSCAYGQAYSTHGAPFTPFQFARPLIQLDESVLINKLQSSRLPEGTYTGTIMTDPYYMYLSDGGAWTYRLFGPMPITIRIIYKPSYLDSVTVSGTGIMTTTYNTTNHTVSGQTRFLINANGIFTSGLKLTFDDRKYELIHTRWPNKKIPYDVTLNCNSCIPKKIIEDGGLTLPSKSITVYQSGSYNNNINFDLLMKFNNAAISQIETGKYTDFFTVYFEENI